MRKERAGRTLQTTALIHDAYLQLIDANRVQWRNRAHFFGVAARLMRRIPVAKAAREGVLLANAQKPTLSELGDLKERISQLRACIGHNSVTRTARPLFPAKVYRNR